MRTFTFYLQAGDGTIPAFEIALFETDGEAFAYARKLLRERPRYSKVSITEGDREVAELSRMSPAAAGAAMKLGAGA